MLALREVHCCFYVVMLLASQLTVVSSVCSLTRGRMVKQSRTT